MSSSFSSFQLRRLTSFFLVLWILCSLIASAPTPDDPSTPPPPQPPPVPPDTHEQTTKFPLVAIIILCFSSVVLLTIFFACLYHYRATITRLVLKRPGGLASASSEDPLRNKNSQVSSTRSKSDSRNRRSEKPHSKRSHRSGKRSNHQRSKESTTRDSRKAAKSVIDTDCEGGEVGSSTVIFPTDVIHPEGYAVSLMAVDNTSNNLRNYKERERSSRRTSTGSDSRLVRHATSSLGPKRYSTALLNNGEEFSRVRSDNEFSHVRKASLVGIPNGLVISKSEEEYKVPCRWVTGSYEEANVLNERRSDSSLASASSFKVW